MRKILQIEVKRAFTNRGMLFAILAGTAIVSWHYFGEVLPTYQKQLELQQYMSQKDFNMIYPYNAFDIWIGGNSYTLQQYLYCLLIPVIAVLPYGCSYFQDTYSGFSKNIEIRINKKYYLLGKYIATFLSAGVAVIFPYILSLLLTTATFPSLLPQNANYPAINNQSLWYELFFRHPFAYLIFYFGIIFVYSGFIGGIALCAATFTRYRFVVFVVPMIVYIFFYSFGSLLGKIDMIPVYFLNPSFGKTSVIALVLQCAGMFAFTCFSYFYGEIVSDRV